MRTLRRRVLWTTGHFIISFADQGIASIHSYAALVNQHEIREQESLSSLTIVALPVSILIDP